MCVGIGYKLNADGTTSDFTLLQAWSDNQPRQSRSEYWQAFAGAASNAVAQWKFIPREGVFTPSPAYTVATFVFSDGAMEATREKCKIPSLSQHIAGLMTRRGFRGKASLPSVFDTLAIVIKAEEWNLSNEYRGNHPSTSQRLEHMQAMAQLRQDTYTATQK